MHTFMAAQVCLLLVTRVEDGRTADVAGPPTGRTPSVGSWWRRAAGLRETRWAATACLALAAGACLEAAGAPPGWWWTPYLACYAAGGWEPAVAGLRALRRRTLDVDLLMVLAAVVAAAIGQVLDGALLIVIFATSGALEAAATARTRDSVRALLDLAPPTAIRLPDGGAEETVPAVRLAVGDMVLVRPGARVPADGTVLDGLSEVDQASITGEALPAVKGPGSRGFAGTLNGTGALTLRVDRPAGESVLARIVALVEEASGTKAGAQLYVESVEQRYSVAMVGATLALLVVPLLAGAALRPTLLRAMTFMIVASPCAVVLATMPPLLAAIANAGRHGVLVKSAVVLERLAGVDLAALDKTGTLTEGTPVLVDVHLLTDTDPDRVLRLAAAPNDPANTRSPPPWSPPPARPAWNCPMRRGSHPPRGEVWPRPSRAVGSRWVDPTCCGTRRWTRRPRPPPRWPGPRPRAGRRSWSSSTGHPWPC